MKKILVLVPLLFFAACATTTVDKARMASIKRVAIVGFTVEQEIPSGIQLFGKADTPTFGANGLIQEAPHAGDMYAALQKELRNDLKWVAVDRATVANNPYYMKLHDKYLKGIQNRPPIAGDSKAFGAAGIIDEYPIWRMSPEERGELAKALGVDAVAMAKVKVRLEKGGGLKMLVGAGDFKPRATISFAVYAPGGEKPVWQDYNAVGDAVEEGVGHVFGGTDRDKLNAKAIEAAKNSYQKLVEHYHNG